MLSIDLHGKHAVITGAGSGIGAACAMALAEAGAAVSLLGRRLDALEQTAQSLRHAVPSAKIHLAKCDVTDEASGQAAFASARQVLGAITHLINNAGQAKAAPFSKTTLADWQAMFAVNSTGVFLCTQAALPDMLAAKSGRIINIASTAGQKGYAYVSAYVAAKHSIIGLTRALALELATKNITVNAVCPGYTDTEIVSNAVNQIVQTTQRTAEQARQELSKSNPVGRLLMPREVADMVLWLASDKAASLTGQSLSVSLGEVM